MSCWYWQCKFGGSAEMHKIAILYGLTLRVVFEMSRVVLLISMVNDVNRIYFLRYVELMLCSIVRRLHLWVVIESCSTRSMLKALWMSLNYASSKMFRFEKIYINLINWCDCIWKAAEDLLVQHIVFDCNWQMIILVVNCSPLYRDGADSWSPMSLFSTFCKILANT